MTDGRTFASASGLRASVEPLPNMPGHAFAIVHDGRGEFFAAIRANGALSFPQILTTARAQELADAFNAEQED